MGQIKFVGDEQPSMTTSTSLESGNLAAGGPLVTPSEGFNESQASTGQLSGGQMPGGKGEIESPVK